MATSDRFAEIAENFAALDFTPENIEIEALTAESTRLRAGIDKAEARCTVIASLKNEYRNAGREVADALLGEGSAIEAANLSPGPEALESAAKAISDGAATVSGGNARGRIITVAGDVAKAADIKHIHAEATKAFGQVDILVNNAGVSRSGALCRG